MAANFDLLDISTPLPAASFKIVSLSGEGSISAPFVYHAALRSGDHKIDQNDLLYQPVTITLTTGDTNKAYINGLVLSLAQVPSDSVGSNVSGLQGFWDYQIVIVPKLFFLSQTSDCRFFENQTALAIAQTVLAEFNITDIEIRVSGSLPSNPYTVMFNETYLEFLNRIFSADGLFYFFEHSAETHSLVIGNSNTAFKTIPTSPLLFASQSETASDIRSWQQHDATAVGNANRADYNPTTASAAVQGEEPTILTAQGTANRHHFGWPAFAADSSAAQAAAKRHIQAGEVRAHIFSGVATVPTLYAGAQFTLRGDPTAAGGSTAYVVSAVRLIASDDASDGNASTSIVGETTISAAITAFPDETAWQPLPLPKPAMAGFYSATVIGPPGEEIYTDKLGRIKVRFPWDHRGETTASGSFWLRVVQPWAGAGWGAQFIPRVGQEVAVTFLEGDIDRPVAVGALYNSTNTPIYPPADKNKSGFRSRSTKGGGAADYNEISFDDTKGSEILLFHAQKDHHVEVEHDQTITVDHDQTLTVKNDRTITVKHDETTTVDNNRTVTVKNNEAITIQGTQTVKVTQAVQYSSDQSITIKVGGSSIKIDPSSITLSATMIKIEAQAQLETSGAIVKHGGEGMMTLQAPLIKVN